MLASHVPFEAARVSTPVMNRPAEPSAAVLATRRLFGGFVSCIFYGGHHCTPVVVVAPTD